MASRILLRSFSSLTGSPHSRHNGRQQRRGFAAPTAVCRVPRGVTGPGGGAHGNGGPFRPYRISSSSQVLLDKFVKRVKGEASFIVKAPFNLKVSF